MRNLFKLIIITFIFIGCNKDDEIEENTEGNTKEQIKTIELKGNVIFPKGFSNEKIGKLEVISGFYKNKVDESQKSAAAKSNNENLGDITKSCKIITYEGRPQIHSILNNGKPLFCVITNNVNKNDEVIVSVESTAISMLLTHPLLITSTASEIEYLTGIMKRSVFFPKLKSEINRLILSNANLTLDRTALKNYNLVVGDVLNKISENYQISKSGLEILDLKKSGNKISFNLKNYHKRYITTYAESLSKGKLNDEKIEVNGKYHDSKTMIPNDYSWVKMFTSGNSDQITKTSEKYYIENSNADQFLVKIYGIGKPSTIPAFGTKDFDRAVKPVSNTLFFEILTPAWDLITGFPVKKSIKKSIAYSTRSDLFDFNNDTHLKDMYEKIIKNTITKRSFLYDKVKSYHTGEFSLFNVLLGVAGDLGGDEEFVNALYNYCLNKFVIEKGISSVDKLASSFQNAFIVGKAINILNYTGDFINLTEAAASVKYSDWVTTYRINNDGKEIKDKILAFGSSGDDNSTFVKRLNDKYTLIQNYHNSADYFFNDYSGNSLISLFDNRGRMVFSKEIKNYRNLTSFRIKYATFYNNKIHLIGQEERKGRGGTSNSEHKYIVMSLKGDIERSVFYNYTAGNSANYFFQDNRSVYYAGSYTKLNYSCGYTYNYWSNSIATKLDLLTKETEWRMYDRYFNKTSCGSEDGIISLGLFNNDLHALYYEDSTPWGQNGKEFDLYVARISYGNGAMLSKNKIKIDGISKHVKKSIVYDGHFYLLNKTNDNFLYKVSKDGDFQKININIPITDFDIENNKVYAIGNQNNKGLLNVYDISKNNVVTSKEYGEIGSTNLNSISVYEKSVSLSGRSNSKEFLKLNRGGYDAFLILTEL